MEKYKVIALSLAIGVSLFFAPNLMINAEADGPANEIGFAIRPNLPDNQFDETVGYFYLDVAPGTEQTINVTVYNSNDHDIQVQLEANAAISNQNGLIEYAGSETLGASIFGSTDDAPLFEDIVGVLEPLLTVPANGSADAMVLLSVPETPFDGEVLGGLVITKLAQEDGDSGSKAAGMTIRNVYAYAVAVRLHQSDAIIEPELRFIGTRQETIAGWQALFFEVENTKPLVMKDISISLIGYDAQGGVAFEKSDIVDMAPNSVMPYCLLLDDEQRLTPGDYIVDIVLEFLAVRWQFETSLTVE